MQTYTTSIFVELEIKVSGTLTQGCRESHDPPSPAEPGGWEDVTIEGIVSHAVRWKDGEFQSLPFELLSAKHAYDGPIMREFSGNLEREFSEEIESALSTEVPDGPDPDDARDARIDARIDARLMGDD